MLKSGDIIKNKWHVEELVGKGAFGEVCSLKPDKSLGYNVCIKFSKIPKNVKTAIGKEEKRAADLIYYEYNLFIGRLESFPYRPRTPKNFYGEDKGVRYIIMERLNLTLKDFFYKRKKSSQLIIDYGKDILKGLKWLHNNGILCLDIKPDNFMLDENKKLYFIDYGLMTLNTPFFRNRPEPVIPEGTPTYVSLDVQKGMIPSYKDDIESMVYMLISLKRGKLPWSKEKSLEETFRKKEKYTKNGKLQKLCDKYDFENLWLILVYVWSLDKNSKVDYKIVEGFLENIS